MVNELNPIRYTSIFNFLVLQLFWQPLAFSSKFFSEDDFKALVGWRKNDFLPQNRNDLYFVCQRAFEIRNFVIRKKSKNTQILLFLQKSMISYQLLFVNAEAETNEITQSSGKLLLFLSNFVSWESDFWKKPTNSFATIFAGTGKQNLTLFFCDSTNIVVSEDKHGLFLSEKKVPTNRRRKLLLHCYGPGACSQDSHWRSCI